ncbi:prostaglandin D2 receptor isoform X1 [Delphinus delphis]|uniref:prostaglandin D2 receptor isoform X1 n=1 Tax=Delphinus delphis TaxID=9728 RepID=UPI0028C50C1C|nr:prostaglandin D2 receptor isoform X1 [Delphinus delphis]
MRPLFYRCCNTTSVEKGNSATMGGLLFSTGLLGNLLALGLLARSGLRTCPRRSPRPPPSVFYVLVCGLTVTDLLGKSLVSPFVLSAYAQNRSLRGLAPASGSSLCQTFAFFMSFFGLASTLQLLAMALECWLSLGHPFFYRRYITPRRGALVAPVVGAFCLAFCSLPFAGFGKFVQYCPGTWCFIQMVHEERSLSVLSYSVLYASLMLLLVLAVVLCNLSAMRNLYAMHLRLRRLPRSGPKERAELAAGEREETPQPLEELDHLLLLALMTVLFTMCSLPLIVSRLALRLRETEARRAAVAGREGWGALDAVQEELRPEPGGFVAAFPGSASLHSPQEIEPNLLSQRSIVLTTERLKLFTRKMELLKKLKTSEPYASSL